MRKSIVVAVLVFCLIIAAFMFSVVDGDFARLLPDGRFGVLEPVFFALFLVLFLAGAWVLSKAATRFRRKHASINRHKKSG